MERFTPLYAVAYAIMNSIEKLRFGKLGYFHVLVFYTSYFINKIENNFSRVPIRYRNTRGSLGEREIEVGTRARRASVSTHFRVFIPLVLL